MKGIKPHTHQDRSKIINALIPQMKKKYGENFVALAADGSFARGEDREYSDLELVVFLNKINSHQSEPLRAIIDGLYIVIIPETKESFIEKYLDISDVWYASGAGKLLPIINEEFIAKINSFKPENVESKCLQQVQKRWVFYQEITAKLLNEIKKENKNALPLIFSDMMKEILVLLSFLNVTPYKTLGSYVSQAKMFKILPKNFDSLLDIYIKGDYRELEEMGKVADTVFSSMEEILEEKGIHVYKQKDYREIF